MAITTSTLRYFKDLCVRKRCLLITIVIVLAVYLWISNTTLYYLTVKSCLGLSSTDFPVYCKLKAPVQQSASMDELKNAFMDELVHVQKGISKARLHSRSGITTRTLMDVHTRVEKLMRSLDENYHGVTEQETTALNIKQSKKPFVCPEVYHGTLAGYPIYKKGWDIANCSGVPPLNQVVTILLNLQNIPNPRKAATSILLDLEKVHSGLTVLIATKEDFGTKSYGLSIKLFPATEAPGIVWKKLIAQVNTPYLLIGRDIERVSMDIRIERLIRIAQSFDVDVVGGAIRTPNGHWSSACRQMTLRNYTLAYIEGYDVSRNACLYCEHLTGPFVARTEAMKKIGFFMFDPYLSEEVLFEDFFISLKLNDRLLMSCPDSMFLIHDHEWKKESKFNWLPLVKKHEINRIHLYNGNVLRYTCEEAQTPCIPTKYAGRVLPICCLELLAGCLNLFFKLSDNKKYITKVDSGSVLGSLKFNGILPWERDADIDYSNSNHSAIAEFKSMLKQGGCILEETKTPEKDGAGYYALRVASWRIELWGVDKVPTETEVLRGWNLTRILTHGYWQPLPFNPGYWGRARYGYDIYKHVQHYGELGEDSGWILYKPGHFTPCSKPGHHSCLDNFLGDGNIQFKIPW